MEPRTEQDREEERFWNKEHSHQVETVLDEMRADHLNGFEKLSDLVTGFALDETQQEFLLSVRYALLSNDEAEIGRRMKAVLSKALGHYEEYYRD